MRWSKNQPRQTPGIGTGRVRKGLWGNWISGIWTVEALLESWGTLLAVAGIDASRDRVDKPPRACYGLPSLVDN